MDKLIPDKWLLLVSVLSLGAAVVSLVWFKSLPSPLKPVLFASVFVCPAITLLAIAKLVKGATPGFVMGCCAVCGAFGTVCWALVALAKIESFR